MAMRNEGVWEEAARQLGIPADRMGLVKRNQELKEKLNVAVKLLETIRAAQHEGYRHDGEAGQCKMQTCAGIGNVLNLIKP